MVKQETPNSVEIRLNVIIGLLSESLISQEKTTPASIYQILDRSGLTPTEIGNIFGKNRSDIGSVLTRAKQSKTKKDTNKVDKKR